MWEWILRKWDNSGRNIKLDQFNFIDMSPLSGGSRFNIEAYTGCKVSEVSGLLNNFSSDGLLKTAGNA